MQHSFCRRYRPLHTANRTPDRRQALPIRAPSRVLRAEVRAQHDMQPRFLSPVAKHAAGIRSMMPLNGNFGVASCAAQMNASNRRSRWVAWVAWNRSNGESSCTVRYERDG